MSGYPDAAAAPMERALTWAKASDHPPTIAYSHVVAALLEHLLGDDTRSAEHAAQVGEISAKHGFPRWHSWSVALGGYATGIAGAANAARVEIDAGLDEWRRSAGDLCCPYFQSLSARLLPGRGRDRQAREVLDLALEHIAEKVSAEKVSEPLEKARNLFIKSMWWPYHVPRLGFVSDEVSAAVNDGERCKVG